MRGAASRTIPRLRVLVLYWSPQPGTMRPAIRHHLGALAHGRNRHEVVYYNALQGAPRWLSRLDFDAVVLHTTLLCIRWSHLFPLLKWRLGWLSAIDAVKIAAPQDEYDHSEILDEWLFELGTDVILSNFTGSLRRVLYPIMQERAHFEHALTGYIDPLTLERCRKLRRPLKERALDVVYRATDLPMWFGRHGRLKSEIGRVVAQYASARGLRCNVSTRPDDVLVGEDWFRFLASGRSVLGCESGSSVLDRRGEIRAHIQWRQATASAPLAFEDLDRELPAGWDEHAFVAVSPRHFEAAMTGTAQVLVEGSYDGVLEAGRHYVPIRRDLSNLDEVVERIQDVDYLQACAEAAVEEVAESGRYEYASLAETIEDAVLKLNPRAGSRRRSLRGLRRIAGRVVEVRSRRVRGERFLGLLSGDPRRRAVLTLLALHGLWWSAAAKKAVRRWAAPGADRSWAALRALLNDVLHVAILRAIVRGSPRLETSVEWEIGGAEEGRIARIVTWVGREEPRDAWAVGLAAADHERLIWVHRPPEARIWYRVAGSRCVRLWIGEGGVHRFRGLAEDARAVVRELQELADGKGRRPSDREE